MIKRRSDADATWNGRASITALLNHLSLPVDCSATAATGGNGELLMQRPWQRSNINKESKHGQVDLAP